MSKKAKGNVRDTYGHSERVTARCRQYNEEGALDGIRKQEKDATAEQAAMVVTNMNSLPAANLSIKGVTENRCSVNSTRDPVLFFGKTVQWLSEPTQIEIRTKSEQIKSEEVKVVGIVDSSIVVDVSKIIAGQPAVINCNVLVDPKDWEDLCAAEKK